MSDNETIVGSTDDLNDFEDLFYGRATPKEEVAEDEDVNQDEAEDEESEVDDAEVEGDDDDEADPADDESDESEEDEEDEKPRRNRKTAKERIKEQTAAIKRLERELEALSRVKELEDKAAPKPSEEKVEVEEAKAPDPDAKDDKGEPLFPLGEFDPAYIRALTRFTIEQETARAEKILEEKRQQSEAQQARVKQQEAWVTRLEEAEQELPDVREKIATLGVMFENIDQSYGQYLVAVVQSLDNGPAILHYLANNPKEAKSIVGSGATVATLSLGRLDAQLGAERSRKEKVVKVSKAPEPPKKTPRGSGGKFSVPDDTDDLDAFSEKFFSKKK